MTAPDYRGMLSAEAVARLVADARGEVARAVLAVAERHTLGGNWWALDRDLRAALAPYMPSQAPDGPSGGFAALERTTGTTGPECGTQAPSGTMRCQLRRGHGGPHEDWRGV